MFLNLSTANVHIRNPLFNTQLTADLHSSDGAAIKDDNWSQRSHTLRITYSREPIKKHESSL